MRVRALGAEGLWRGRRGLGLHSCRKHPSSDGFSSLHYITPHAFIHTLVSAIPNPSHLDIPHLKMPPVRKHHHAPGRPTIATRSSPYEQATPRQVAHASPHLQDPKPIKQEPGHEISEFLPTIRGRHLSTVVGPEGARVYGGFSHEAERSFPTITYTATGNDGSQTKQLSKVLKIKSRINATYEEHRMHDAFLAAGLGSGLGKLAEPIYLYDSGDEGVDGTAPSECLSDCGFEPDLYGRYREHQHPVAGVKALHAHIESVPGDLSDATRAAFRFADANIGTRSAIFIDKENTTTPIMGYNKNDYVIHRTVQCNCTLDVFARNPNATLITVYDYDIEINRKADLLVYIGIPPQGVKHLLKTAKSFARKGHDTRVVIVVGEKEFEETAWLLMEELIEDGMPY